MKIEQMLVYRVEDMIFDTPDDAQAYINRCNLREEIEGLISAAAIDHGPFTKNYDNFNSLMNKIMLKIDAAKGVD